MSRFLFCALLSLFTTVLFAAEEHIHREPMPDFKQDFENVKAGITTLIHEQGISGKALKIGPLTDGKKAYMRLGGQSLPKSGGTVLFWVKPLDWDTAKGLQVLFDARKGGQMLTFTSFMNKNTRMLVATVKINGKDYHIRENISKWKMQEWHQVVLSYDENEYRLYVDGLGVKAERFPVFSSEFEAIFMGGEPGWRSGLDGNSLIDDVSVFKKVLTEDEIQFLYNKYAKDFAPAVTDTVQLNLRTPVLDGRIDEFEYAFGGTGFTDIKTGSYAVFQSRYYLSYDRENFYFAVKSPITSGLMTNKTANDQDIWEDDSVEFHAATGKGDYFQFIFNSAGMMWDAQNLELGWNSEGVKTMNKIENGYWTMECAIPLRELNQEHMKPGTNWKINVCRSYKSDNSYTSSAPCRKEYRNSANFTELNFQVNPLAYEIVSLGDLNSGKLDFKVRLNSSNPANVRVHLESPLTIHSYAWSDNLAIKANETVERRIVNNALPKDNTLITSIESPEFGTVFKNVQTYREALPLKLSHIYTDIEMRKLIAVCRRGAPASGLIMRLRMNDKDSGTEVFTRQVPVNADAFLFNIEYDIAELPPGRYNMLLECLDPAGKVLFAHHGYYLMPSEHIPWLEQNIAVADETPRPWTPPVFGQSSFECWNRRTTLGGGGLISSLASGGKELLAGPVRITVNGKSNDKVTAERTDQKQSTAQYALETTAGNVKVKAEVHAEFDGFMLFDLTFTPAGNPVRVERLTMDIPVRKDMADAFDNNQSFRTKTLLENASYPVYTDLSAMPSVWIGNMNSGLMWGAENLKGWYLKNKTRALELTSQENAYNLRFNLIDTPMELKTPRKIRFYLQATPVKPLNPVARMCRQMDNSFSEAGEYWLSMFDTPADEYVEPKAIQWYRRLEKERFPYLFFYSTAHAASPVSPEWNYFGKLWHSPLPLFGNYYGDINNPDTKRRDKRAYTLSCLSCESFFKFKVNNLAAMIPKQDINNLYFDISWPKMCGNTEHGCGWRDEFGVEQSSFSVLSTRKYYQTLCQELRKQNPNGMIMQHLLGTTRTPAENFTDMFLFGEVYEHDIGAKETYFGVFKPDVMRIAYAYRTREQNCTMSKEFSRALAVKRPDRYKTWNPHDPVSDRNIKHFIGYCYVNNLELHLQYWLKEVNFFRPYQAYDAEKWLGDNYGAAVFHPYWRKNSNPVTVSATKEVMVSTRILDNRMLLTILNDSDRDTQATIKFNQLSNGKGFNAFDKDHEIYDISNGELKLQLGPRDAKILCIE